MYVVRSDLIRDMVGGCGYIRFFFLVKVYVGVWVRLGFTKTPILTLPKPIESMNKAHSSMPTTNCVRQTVSSDAL